MAGSWLTQLHPFVLCARVSVQGHQRAHVQARTRVRIWDTLCFSTVFFTAKRDRLTALQAESLSGLRRRIGKENLKGASTVERKGELLRCMKVLKKVC